MRVFRARNSNAVSTIVSLILAVALTILISSAVFLMGTPIINQKESELTGDTVFTDLSVASDSIADMIQDEIENTKQVYPVDIPDGSLSVDTEGDRMVVSYSLDDKYEFLVNGLDDNDGDFSVIVNKGPLVDFFAKVYRFHDESTYLHPQEPRYGQLINYTDVTFNWTDIAVVGEEYSYRLDGLSSYWSQFSDITNKTYFDLADKSNYSFQVKKKSSDNLIKKVNFTIIEDMDGNNTAGAKSPGPTGSEWSFHIDFPLEETIRIDLYNETGYPVDRGIMMSEEGSETFDATRSNHLSMLQINGDFYAIAYGGFKKGCLATYEIKTDGTIASAPTSYHEFENGWKLDRNPDIVHVAGDVYAIAYSARLNNVVRNGSLITVQIDGNGVIYPETIQRFEFESGAVNSVDIEPVFGGDYYAIVYEMGGVSGWITTVEIKPDGTINPGPGGSQFFQLSVCADPVITHIQGEYYAIVNSGENNWGYLRIWHIAADGTIDPSETDVEKFDEIRCFEPRILHLAGDIFAVVYRGDADDGYIKTFEISSVPFWDITSVDSYEFDDEGCRFPHIIPIGGEFYRVVYTGTGNGSLVTLKINQVGDIQQFAMGRFKFFAADCQFSEIIQISGDVYAIAFQEKSGFSGLLKTFKDVYPDTYGFPFGRIFLFDFGRIEYLYPTESGNAKTILENMALLSYDGSIDKVQKAPLFMYESNDTSEPDFDEWPMFHHDSQRTGATTSNGPDTTYEKWMATDAMGSTQYSSPIVVHGYVYIGNDEGEIWAFDIETGSPVWSDPFKDNQLDFSQGTPTIYENKLFATSSSKGYLIRINALTGSFEWQSAEVKNQPSLSSPVVLKDMVFMTTYQSKTNKLSGIYCYNVDAESPTPSYKYESSDSDDPLNSFAAGSAPAVYNDKLYVVSEDGYVGCFDETLTTVLDQSASYGPTKSAPVLVDEYVYFGTMAGDIICLKADNLDDNSPEGWTIPIGESIQSTLVVVNDRIVVGTLNNQVHCYLISDQSWKWTYSAGNQIQGSPVYADGKIYVVDSDGVVYWLSFSTGDLIDSIPLDSGSAATPAIYDNKLFVVDDDVRLYCFEDVVDAQVLSPQTLLTLRVSQIRSGTNSGESASGINGFEVSVIENYIRESRTEVYWVKTQFFGENANAWLDFFKNNYGFLEDTGDATGSTLKPAPDDPRVSLSLSQSRVAVNLY